MKVAKQTKQGLSRSCRKATRRADDGLTSRAKRETAVQMSPTAEFCVRSSAYVTGTHAFRPKQREEDRTRKK